MGLFQSLDLFCIDIHFINFHFNIVIISFFNTTPKSKKKQGESMIQDQIEDTLENYKTYLQNKEWL